MNDELYDKYKNYLLAKPESTIDYPFGEDTSVFKVKNKLFALISEVSGNETIREDRKGLMMMNLKINPDESPALRDIYSAITEGYHMNKKHWISIYFDGTVPESEVKRLIDNSFRLVVDVMPKKDQESILRHL